MTESENERDGKDENNFQAGIIGMQFVIREKGSGG